MQTNGEDNVDEIFSRNKAKQRAAMKHTVLRLISLF
jgi:hypothetical protein